MAAKIVVAAVFALVYVWLIVSKHHRAKAFWIGIAIVYIAGFFLNQPVLTLRMPFLYDDKGWQGVNWNVIGIFSGTFLIAEAFIYSRVPAVISDIMVDKSPNVCWAALAVCALSSLISIFIDNVATVLIVAPIAIEMSKRSGITPAPFIIGLALCSNLQGTATLIGDPPSMLLAGEYRLTFNDFFWFHGRPGIFFAVQVGAIFGGGVLWLFYRKRSEPVKRVPVEKARGYVPLFLLGAMVCGLALSSFIDKRFMWMGATTCLTLGLTSNLWVRWKDRKESNKILKGFDFSTAFFLIAVFLMVRCLENVKLIDDLARLIARVTGNNLLGQFFVLVFFSLLVSAFVDNIPYLGIMLGVVRQLALDPNTGQIHYLLPFGLLIGACLGGNITPMGASANVVAYGMLRKRNDPTSFIDFVKVGLPFTMAAVTGGGLFLLVFWYWL